EPFAGLDRRPGEHDALDRVALQRVHRAGDGEVGLAGAGRADAEGDVVRQDVPEVVALARRTAAQVAAPSVEDRSLVLALLALGGGGTLLGQAELDVLERQGPGRRLPEAREHVARLFGGRRIAFDAEALATAGDARVEVLGDGPDVALDRTAKVGQPFIVRRLGGEFDRTGFQAGSQGADGARRRAAGRGYWRVKTPTPSIVVERFGPSIVYPTPRRSPLGPKSPPLMRASQLEPR